MASDPTSVSSVEPIIGQEVRIIGPFAPRPKGQFKGRVERIDPSMDRPSYDCLYVRFGDGTLIPYRRCELKVVENQEEQ